MKFYLAGPVGYGVPGIEWKEEMKQDLRSFGHEVYDPIENDERYLRVSRMNEMKHDPKKYFAEIREIMQEIFMDDCAYIQGCDYAICYFVGRAFGTISEQGIAYFAQKCNGKKVKTICIFDQSFFPDEWVLCCSDYIFFSLDEGKKFVRRLAYEAVRSPS